jgi:hypothetical protein
MPSCKAITDARKYVVAGGSKQGLKVAPSPAKAGSNQVSDEAPFPARGGSNNASDEAAAPTVTTFKWRIDGFSSLLEKGQGQTYSSVFQMRGLIWYYYYHDVSFQLFQHRARCIHCHAQKMHLSLVFSILYLSN